MKIRRSVVEGIIAQARAELPNESCGYLFGETADEVVKNHRMTNIDASPEHFTFDPREQFAAIKTARAEGLRIIANWHSHPSSPSRPSQEDIRLAYDPKVAYFILSLAAEEPVLNAFHIENGQVEKLALEVVEG